MSQIIAIAKINILDIFRDLRSNAIVFVLPVVFILIFGFIFSGTQDITSFKVGVVEENNQIAGVLEQVKDKDDNNLFQLSSYPGSSELVTAIQNREVELGIVLLNNEQKIYFDEGNQRSVILRTLVADLLEPGPPSQFEFSGVTGREDISIFELQVAGLVIYGILIMIPQVAGQLAKLKEGRYVTRYALSRVSSFQILSGFTLSGLFVGTIQTLLLFLVSSWFGLKLDLQALQAYVFVIPVILFSIGIGLLLGAYASRSEAAQNTGTVLSIILGFLSGSFIVGIDRIGITIADRFVAITDFIPTFYATKGMSNLLVYQKSIDSVLTELLVVFLSAVLVFAAGVAIFNRKQLSRA